MHLRLSFAVLVLLFCMSGVHAQADPSSPEASTRQGMNLSSSDIAEGTVISNAQVFNGFGCSGENISPALSWNGVPEAAKSLALTVYDPDAPTGSGWWHWVVINMPVETNGLPGGASKSAAMPEGALESMTDFGAPGYGGPCPPVGDTPHHYIFTLHALDVEALELGENTPAAQVGYFLNAHSVGQASFTGMYGR